MRKPNDGQRELEPQNQSDKHCWKNELTSSGLDEFTTASGIIPVFPFFHAKIAGIPLNIRFVFKNAYNSK